jgi:galactoside O-acetyltransferase
MGLLAKGLRELRMFVQFFLTWFPGITGVKLRGLCYKNLFFKCGPGLTISQGCLIKGFKQIVLGHNVSFGPNAQVYAEGTDRFIEIGNNVAANANVMINADNGGSIKIGDNVLIGPNVVLRASNHVFSNRDMPILSQGHKAGAIVIKDDVWLGANAVIVPDVIIGKGAVVGAGAVVTKDVEEYTVVAGVPARKIGARGQ